jgi:hypothetical protein
MADWSEYRDSLPAEDEADVPEVKPEDVEKAYETADRIEKEGTALAKRKYEKGDKRRKMHATWSRKPLDGCSVERSDLLRHIVALRFAGKALKEACEDAANTYEIKPHTAENYYYKHPDAVTLAEEEHLSNAIKEYQINLWTVRTMMSEAGPKAIETIINIMNARKSSPSVKLKAAQTVLKMMDVDGSASGKSGTEVASESLKLVRKIIESREREQEGHVIEADDVEILDKEDDGEVGISDCM